jgi:hypothetical protein
MSYKIQVKLTTNGEYNNSNKNYEWYNLIDKSGKDLEFDKRSDAVASISSHNNNTNTLDTEYRIIKINN